MDERNELIATENVDEEEEMEETTERSGMGTGRAMLLGSGLTLAAIAGAMALKKFWHKHKAKKEQTVSDKKSDDDKIVADEVIVEDVDDPETEEK